MPDNNIKSLTSIEHILLRPTMYISTTKVVENNEWLLEEDSIKYKSVRYVPALEKIINEAIDNSVDEGIKTDWKYSTSIHVDITDDTVTVEDNGRGIPTTKGEDGEYQCVNAVCRPMSGSNFEDDQVGSIGMNGLGIKSSNIFSTYFECVTCDKNGKIKIVCKNNLSEKKVSVLSKTSKTGTKITFKPDFSRFEVDKLDDSLKNLIHTRLKFLSWFYPKCSFFFNGEKINIKAKDMSSLFPSPSVVVTEENFYACIYPTDEPYCLTYVNGIYLRRGGTHVDYVVNKIVSDIRDKVIKRYKSIKPADIRNRLGIVLFFKNFKNCLFDSQTKESLKNSQADIGNYLKENNIDLNKLSMKILKEKEIIDNITEMFKLKEELAEKKALKSANSKKKDIDSDKYFPPVSGSGKKYLMITEGYSAFAGISPILGRKGIGYYSLRGKLLNVLDLPPSKYMQNQEISDLVNILGIDLENPNNSNLNYEYVVVLSDADNDGIHIASLVCTFINKLCPVLFKEKRFCYLRTPVIIESKGDRVMKYYFDLDEYSKSKHDSRLVTKYVKGLGSHTKSQLNQVIDMEGGMENMLQAYKYDDFANDSINNWMGDNSDFRKDKLKGKEFHIDSI